jgi:hypothetical protein
MPKSIHTALATLALLALPASGAVSEPAGLGPALRAAPDEAPAFMLSASGVHVYECRASAADPAAYTWSFVAPDATLYEGSRGIGTHSAPSLWESASDRSSVTGTVRSTQAAGGNNLPWTLFSARPLSESGLFAGVTSIQRVNTAGGAAPLAGCGASRVGAEARVDFKADFYFYRKRPAA